MKKNIFKLLLILCVVFAVSCQHTPEPTRTKPDLSHTDFIYLKDKHFEIRNEKFFPVMLNYIVSSRNINGEFVISPHIDYEEVGVFESHTKEEIAHQLRGHFQLIKEMGFNIIRMCFDRINKNEKDYYYYADGKEFFINTDYNQILEGLETFTNIANEKGLRIMLLLKRPWEDKSLEDFAIKVFEKFKDNPTIFAYDLMNEPLYFDYEQRNKKEVFQIVSHWEKMMRKHAPNQLFTIGLSEPIEVNKWDPALIPVDFVAFHTYHPLRAKSEIYWFSTYGGKPWMIGETALPADNDSISYDDQTSYMREVYQYVVDCGGAGFGWWDFQEAVHGSFEAQFTGILNHEDTTRTQDGNYTILGTVKPAAQILPELADYKPKEKAIPINYYNMMGYNNYVIKGQIVNKKTKQPIEGAVIRSWNKYWSIGQNTYSDENGEFLLYSNDESVHFQISAPNMTSIRFDKNLRYKKIVDGNYDRNYLPDQYLEYHSICYKPYLKDAPVSVFDFDESKFNQAKFKGDLGKLYLMPINK
ncbi:MAG: cellulase family glycosylhydrolase [Lentimicrobiaceae bacterium]|nr:cellulase family glycosylhydrolase [Lentimicrobiaceae bacterium]